MKPHTTRPITRDDALDAMRVLGIKSSLENLEQETVTAAFRSLIRSVHPDTATAVLDGYAYQRLHELQEARKLLISWLEQLPDKNCPACGGSGFVRYSLLGSVPCSRCQN